MGQSRRLEVDINNSFAKQQMTGQQRYASEMSSALLRLDLQEKVDFGIINISPNSGPFLSWMQTLFLGFRARRSAWLLTLTSRGPVWARRHAIVVHDLFVFHKVNWFSPLYRITHSVSLRLQLRFSRLVICVSPFVAAELEHKRYTKARIIVAPNAPSERFEIHNINFSQKEAVLNKFKVREKSFVLALGASDPRKNIGSLINAHKLLPITLRQKFPLLILGKVNSNLFMDVGYEDDQFIKLETRVEDDELALLYNLSAVFVVPSHAEGFGLPLVEALTAGARIIANDIEVFKWVGGKGVIYVSCEETGSMLSDVLADVLCSSPGMHKMERYTSPFSWDVSAKLIMDAISELEDGSQL